MMTITELLVACREKLQLYRDTHSGEYVGGVEFTALRAELDKKIAAGATGCFYCTGIPGAIGNCRACQRPLEDCKCIGGPKR